MYNSCKILICLELFMFGFGHKDWRGVNENLENLKKIQEKLTEAQHIVGHTSFGNGYPLSDEQISYFIEIIKIEVRKAIDREELSSD